MSGGRRRRTSRALRCGVVIAATVALLACVPASLAASPKRPDAIHVAANSLMQSFMQRLDKQGFAEVVDFGRSTTYKVALLHCRIVLDPSLKDAIATYGPKSNVLTLSKDPRTAKGLAKQTWGETLWHEMTHALEDANGDDFTSSDKLYQDRNTWYMKYTVVAFNWLVEMEQRAKAGGSVAQLRTCWNKYLEGMQYANNLEETKKFPPDLALMRKWFGFRANTDEIKALYLNDKAFSGEKWANLRAALVEWTGAWVIDRESMPHITLTQSGSIVTGVWGVPPVSGDVYQPLQGTLSADGLTLTADWTALTTGADGVHMWNEVDHLVAILVPGSKAVPDRWQGTWTGTATRADGKYTSAIDQTFTAERVK
jgi:hypothetical protein